MSDDRERRLARSWARNAASWAEAVRGGRIETRRSATDQAVVEAVLSCGESRVLDVGCGEGWLARRLSAEGRDVVGFDGSAVLVERARELGGGSFIVLTYEAFAADPQSVGRGFGVAVCNFSLLGEHVADLLSALAEVVVREGTLVIQTVHPATVEDRPSEDGWREESFEPLRPLEFSPMPWYYRTVESWKHELEVSGWRSVRMLEPPNPETGAAASLVIIARSGSQPSAAR